LPRASRTPRRPPVRPRTRRRTPRPARRPEALHEVWRASGPACPRTVAEFGNGFAMFRRTMAKTFRQLLAETKDWLPEVPVADVKKRLDSKDGVRLLDVREKDETT